MYFDQGAILEKILRFVWKLKELIIRTDISETVLKLIFYQKYFCMLNDF